MTFYTLETKLYSLSSLCHGSLQLKHFLALCLLSSRSGLQTLDPEKFNGQQRDFATIMWTLNQSGEQIRLQEFVFFFYQILAQMLEVCLELEK